MVVEGDEVGGRDDPAAEVSDTCMQPAVVLSHHMALLQAAHMNLSRTKAVGMF